MAPPPLVLSKGGILASPHQNPPLKPPQGRWSIGWFHGTWGPKLWLGGSQRNAAPNNVTRSLAVAQPETFLSSTLDKQHSTALRSTPPSSLCLPPAAATTTADRGTYRPLRPPTRIHLLDGGRGT